MQVHIIADLRHVDGMPENGSRILDSCVFSQADGQLVSRVPALAQSMFDNHVYYTGFRVVCQSPFNNTTLEPGSLWAGLGLNGVAHSPRIPVTVVRLIIHT